MKKLIYFKKYAASAGLQIVFFISISGCGGSQNSAIDKSSTQYDVTESFVKALLLEDPSARDSYLQGYWIAKVPSNKAGWVVIKRPDPQDPLHKIEYIAIDLRQWRIGDNAHAYLDNSLAKGLAEGDLIGVNIEHDNNWGSDHYLDFQSRVTGFVYERKSRGSKDLEMMAAQHEQFYQSYVAESLQVKLGLSVERAQELSRLVTIAQDRNLRRSLTEKERHAFLKEALGATYAELENAYNNKISGSNEGLDNLIDKVSRHNECSPEGIREILESIIKP